MKYKSFIAVMEYLMNEEIITKIKILNANKKEELIFKKNLIN